MDKETQDWALTKMEAVLYDADLKIHSSARRIEEQLDAMKASITACLDMIEKLKEFL